VRYFEKEKWLDVISVCLKMVNVLKMLAVPVLTLFLEVIALTFYEVYVPELTL